MKAWFFAGLLVLSLIPISAGNADGHWNMEARSWAEDGNGKFFLRIHNGEHANRKPEKKNLNVCFWIEEVGEGSSIRAASEKKCSAVILKPDEWKTFEFRIADAVFDKGMTDNGKIKKGKYRFVAYAREQSGWISKLIFGAAMERLYTYFEVK